jgi:hypothetical protein
MNSKVKSTQSQNPVTNYSKSDNVKAIYLLILSVVLPIVFVILNFIFALSVALSGDDDSITIASEEISVMIFYTNLFLLPLLGLISLVLCSVSMIKKNKKLLKIALILVITMVTITVLPIIGALLFTAETTPY